MSDYSQILKREIETKDIKKRAKTKDSLFFDENKKNEELELLNNCRKQALELTKETEPVQISEIIQSIRTPEQIQPTEPAQTLKSIQTPEPIQTNKPAKITQRPDQPIQPIQPIQTPEPVQTPKPIQPIESDLEPTAEQTIKEKEPFAFSTKKITKPKKIPTSINPPIISKNAFKEKRTIWISLSEASNIGGIQTKTLRRAIKSNKLKYKITSNRYFIDFASLIVFLSSTMKLSNKFKDTGIAQYVKEWKNLD